MPLKKGKIYMTSNKVIKILVVFILCMTVLGCSVSTAFADTIYDCPYLMDVGDKSYDDTLFSEIISSSAFADYFSNAKDGTMYSVVVYDDMAFVEYLNFCDRDKCHLWLGTKGDPAQICLDCWDTFVNTPVLVCNVSSGKFYGYSTTDNYAQFILDLLS